MGLELYKPGQGKNARIVAYVLGLGLIVFGGIRLFATINRPGHEWVSGLPLIDSVSPYNAIAFAVVLLGALGLHLVLNRVGTVDLLIDTEQELKKVSWPSRREVKHATIIVIIVTFTLAIMLYGFDGILRALFRLIY